MNKTDKNKKSYLHAILKFGHHEHMIAFIEHGELYINPISYFKNVEDYRLRGDKDENLTGVFQPSKGAKVAIRDDKGEFVNIEGLVGGIKVYLPPHDEYQLTHIYSMTGVFSEDLFARGPFLNKKIANFGDNSVIIHKPKIFLDRVKEKFLHDGIEFCSGKVKYISSEHDGRIGPFHKFDCYAWQKEFRIGVRSSKYVDKPMKVNIGSIEDIAYICPTKDLKENIRQDGDNIILEFSSYN